MKKQLNESEIRTLTRCWACAGQTLQAIADTCAITYVSTKTMVASLQRRGYLESHFPRVNGRPRRKIYHTTARGYELITWIIECEFDDAKRHEALLADGTK